MTIQARFQISWPDFELDIDLGLPLHGVSALFGPSGCGKTTLLRAMAGLLRCEGGFLRIGDEVWQDGDFFLPPHKRPLGYVFQEASLFSHLNVRDNLQYGLRRVPAAGSKVALQDAVDLLGIGHLMQRRTRELSGGERQRVAIARALAVSPGILLMDEPLASLDLERKQEIMPYLESLHDQLNIPLIYVSHSPEEVARLADHLVVLHRGRVTAADRVGELLARLDLPLAHGDDAASVIEVRVVQHDERFALTHLEFAGGQFLVGKRSYPVGHVTRLRVGARDVSITLERQSHTSILNIFPALVEEMVPDGASQFIVRLRLEGIPLLSRVTRKSARLLDLRPGKRVYAQIKSVSLLD